MKLLNLLFLISFGWALPLSAADRLNVLIIMSDDLNTALEEKPDWVEAANQSDRGLSR